MGCPDEFVLRLQRDGRALLTLPGNARLGQAEKHLGGRVPRRDFDALVRQLGAAGFFAMDEIYEDPQMRDGSTSTLGVERGSAVKQVTSREGAGPESLSGLLVATESLRSKIEFKAIP